MLQMPERAVPAPGQSGPEAAAQEPYKSKVPGLDEDSVNQLSRDEQEMLKTKHKAAEEADKKVLVGGDGLEELWVGDRGCSVC
jgi:epidermal growth factor receptor substrate 15